MNHIENYQFEVYVPKEERSWISWANCVEAYLGHSLDGDLSKDGYSLDRAYSHFKLGSSVLEYVKDVRQMSQYKKPNAGSCRPELIRKQERLILWWRFDSLGF